MFEFRTMLGQNTKEYYEDMAIKKPKQYIANKIKIGKEQKKISFSMLEKILKEQDFEHATRTTQYYEQTDRLSNYKIDSLLRILDALDLELVVKPKTK